MAKEVLVRRGAAGLLFAKLDDARPAQPSSTRVRRNISPKVRALRDAARLNDGRE